ncbi:MAG TPA: hypothetical protein VFI91_08330 [Longimicrobiaceae bacterium]|nr:hypothetical protein [Longimicrobiaceae bacterium]
MRSVATWMLLAVPTLAAIGCEATADTASETALDETSSVVEVTATGLELTGPSEIPSGWTTLRLNNESEMTHFAVLERLPDSIGIEHQQAEVAPVFQAGMDLLNAGQVDAAMAKFGELPAWYGKVVFMGGPGLIAAGETAESTVYLEPGTYLLECYVKTAGRFHSARPAPDMYGMVHEITVTDERSEATEPESTIDITLSSTRGIETDGNLVAGPQTIAVHFEDQVVHEHFLGHDVHLVRLAEDTDLEELEIWMDWTQPTGLTTPAPVEFVGGIQEMPAGSTGYFTAVLEPGRYAWISEVPNAGDKGMLKSFTVSAAEDATN